VARKIIEVYEQVLRKREDHARAALRLTS
jgi:hypothetical protein